MKEITNIENGFANIQTTLNAKKEINDMLPEEILFFADNLQEQVDTIRSNAEKLNTPDVEKYSLRVMQCNTHNVNDPYNEQFDILQILFNGEWCNLDDRMIHTLTIEILEKLGRGNKKECVNVA